jgi:hypothetical protein
MQLVLHHRFRRPLSIEGATVVNSKCPRFESVKRLTMHALLLLRNSNSGLYSEVLVVFFDLFTRVVLNILHE